MLIQLVNLINNFQKIKDFYCHLHSAGRHFILIILYNIDITVIQTSITMAFNDTLNDVSYQCI